ncbi:hypothetical protein PVL29_015890 [Vitis rotundifolia]|uniref:Reverse transcriptase zinc-binding domain-containing protein n=1 Tax=Vitis rotundifolia TaxID=103349 RepID=A0AA38ZE40_VITRO|nr:hypothetical protein PVL29_015890 [Vitis rotundifolia]
MERKAHLVNWEVVCGDKVNGGLGIRKLTLMNRALLGKWAWRFAYDKEALWKQVLVAKHELEDHDWRTKKAVGACGVGVWKEILKEADWCWDKMVFKVGKRNRIKFWTDVWCGDSALYQRFQQLYILVANRNALVEDLWDQNVGEGGWNLRFIGDFNDWEVEMVGELLQALRDFRIVWEDDSVFWKGGGSGQFRVKDAYSWLDRPTNVIFPKNKIWMERVPTKISFFAWEATWGKIWTLDRLQKRGWQLPNRCFLCACEAESVNHILIHCTVVRVIWDLVLGLVGVKWVFPNTVKEVLYSWGGAFVGRKRKKLWNSIPCFIFWTVWKERNRLAFRGGDLDIQRLKYSFVCNIWGWAKLYMEEGPHSLLDFLDWLASS